MFILQKTHPQKAAKLLQILHTKDSSAYHSFLSALNRGGYDYIAEQMEGNASGTKVRRYSDADVQSLLVEGGVPARPQCYIDRPTQLDKIRGCLQMLEDSPGWVVVHGMSGSGKSVLAAEALRCSDLISQLFPGGIFWLSIGQTGHSKLLLRMQNLSSRLNKCQHSTPNNLEEAKDRLRYVLAHEFPKSLLILDDVWSSHVVKAFDIQCRFVSIRLKLNSPVYRQIINVLFNYHPVVLSIM